MRALENPRPCNNRPPTWRIWPGEVPYPNSLQTGGMRRRSESPKGNPACQLCSKCHNEYGNDLFCDCHSNFSLSFVANQRTVKIAVIINMVGSMKYALPNSGRHTPATAKPNIELPCVVSFCHWLINITMNRAVITKPTPFMSVTALQAETAPIIVPLSMICIDISKQIT